MWEFACLAYFTVFIQLITRPVECVCELSSAQGLSPPVRLSTGYVQGLSCVSALGRPYYSFRGIPYAAPPLGPLRFRAPRPHPPWAGTLQATKEAAACTQPNKTFSFPITFSEDCLFVNVYTPYLKHPTGRLLPVIVWVFGGKFYEGTFSSYKYGADFLMERDIIVVSINYRLGVLGYLNMNVPGAQGNSAMKDKVAALKWVRREIYNFGGDPTLVTVFGGSSGATAVHLLHISPMTKGLFKRVIIHSAPNMKTRIYENANVKLGFELGRLVGCDTNSPQDLVTCLRGVLPQELVEKQMNFQPNKVAECSFMPTIETDYGEEVFLPEHPLALLNSAPSIPHIMGINNGEGLISVFDPDTHKQFDAIQEQLVTYLPAIILKWASPSVLSKVVSDIYNFYFKNCTTFSDSVYGYIDFQTDNHFAHGMLKTAQDLSIRSPVYFFYFSYLGSFVEDKHYLKLNISIPEVCHGDELAYFFYRNFTLPVQNDLYSIPRDMNMVDRLTTIWTHFATYGDPTPFSGLWQPVKGKYTQHLSIDDEIVMIHRPLLEARVEFWDRLYHFVFYQPREYQYGFTAMYIIACLVGACFFLFVLVKVAKYIKQKGYTLLEEHV